MTNSNIVSFHSFEVCCNFEVAVTVAIVIMSGLREKLNHIPFNKHLKGFPIAMLTAMFIAMAFYVFSMISL